MMLTSILISFSSRIL